MICIPFSFHHSVFTVIPQDPAPAGCPSPVPAKCTVMQIEKIRMEKRKKSGWADVAGRLYIKLVFYLASNIRKFSGKQGDPGKRSAFQNVVLHPCARHCRTRAVHRHCDEGSNPVKE
jgi:hypothetical protein